jgi:hypothetical protein
MEKGFMTWSDGMLEASFTDEARCLLWSVKTIPLCLATFVTEHESQDSPSERTALAEPPGLHVHNTTIPIIESNDSAIRDSSDIINAPAMDPVLSLFFASLL